MAKISRGRIAGRNGMHTFSVEELERWAAKLEDEARIGHPTSTDDIPWLRRWADKIRDLAAQKEQAREHKSGQRRKTRRTRCGS